MSVRTGDLYRERPVDVPKRVWTDLERRACDLGSLERLHKQLLAHRLRELVI